MNVALIVGYMLMVGVGVMRYIGEPGALLTK